MVTDGQVRVLRRKLLMEGKTQEAAAAGAGMSVRSARRWQAGAYPSQARKPHLWRTRADPFVVVFENEVTPYTTAHLSHRQTELGRGRHLRERRVGRAHPSNAVIHHVVIGHYRNIAERGLLAKHPAIEPFGPVFKVAARSIIKP